VRLLYFAYGSNLSSARLRARLEEVEVVGPAVLAEHRLALDKRGHDGSAKANVVRHPGERVWGVVYELATAHVEVLDRFEGGYERVGVEVHHGQRVVVEASHPLGHLGGGRLEEPGRHRRRCGDHHLQLPALAQQGPDGLRSPVYPGFPGDHRR